jgi:hypothetical protein
MILAGVWFCSAFLTFVIALIVFLAAMVWKRKTMGKRMIGLTCACFGCGVSLLLFMPAITLLRWLSVHDWFITEIAKLFV